ncbi:glycogen synthase [Isoptericola halotolerans]|uniref:Glycosyltransferase involved in cell wall biosynthesis n=1 Tax=Isoptericola halotolerans TaxID=300560 RepID=A0ABX2A756_9MICO|nr:glycosyltransferase involved in cell wall biosynthesis [Isoptericola halotolerans]
MSRYVHVLTPGDHYSPRTGSAVPTVVHGLNAATASPPAVVVARGTYADRYDDAEAIEYTPAPGPGRWERRLDAVRAPLGLPRAARRTWAAALAGQDSWEPATVVLHNAPQAVALVHAQHQPVLYAHNDLLRTYTRREAGRALGEVSAIVCVSDHLAERTTARLPHSLRERVHVVRNGVDTDLFRPGPGFPDRVQELRIVFVGRTIPDKGPAVLLDAVETLDRDDVHVTVVGSAGFSATDPLTPYERRLRATAGRLGGRATVRPFVPRTEVPGLLASADVVVVPSVWPDPCPLTVLEGMAAGAALVASDVGGIPETVADAGTLVAPGDTAALASALGHLADDPVALATARRKARSHAEARDWSVVASELAAVLEPARRTP